MAQTTLHPLLKHGPQGQASERNRIATVADKPGTVEQQSAAGPCDHPHFPEIGKLERHYGHINVRAGDTLLIPKRPSFVMVTAEKFTNPTAFFRLGKARSGIWPSRAALRSLPIKKRSSRIRVHGSVIGSRNSAWSGDPMSSELQPGDTL